MASMRSNAFSSIWLASMPDMPGIMLEHGTRAAHLADLRKLGQHIVHIELVFHHPLGRLFGGLFVGGILCPLDEAEHIAHAKDAACHAGGVEDLEVIQLFADALELDGLAGDGTARKAPRRRGYRRRSW